MRKLWRRLLCRFGQHEIFCGDGRVWCWHCGWYEPYDPAVTAKILSDLDANDWNHYR